MNKKWLIEKSKEIQTLADKHVTTCFSSTKQSMVHALKVSILSVLVVDGGNTSNNSWIKIDTAVDNATLVYVCQQPAPVDLGYTPKLCKVYKPIESLHN